ncbi:DNA methylase [Arthrobacter phage Coral]|uniref:DNA methylase n=3 Tax=Coralvirus coral TaxID=2734227 RepID=A0A5J6TRW9_9CAUD|nr:DNA methyltransferase [Arthrobacter phage Coral]AYN57521.1 DNA methylase [Arthrobacter phage Coral]AYN58802.1 DNA methylase [Arthrobacter phage Polka]QFG13098.1 DNA methylase [Arthrobacter phage Amelia]
MSGRRVVVSLCDITGHMVEPWVAAGYEAVLVDPQHEVTRQEGPVLKFAGVVADVAELVGRLAREGRVAIVFGFPPCTDLAVSGAGWFAGKYEKDKLFQAKAVAVAEQCRTIGKMSGAPWFVENPVSVLASVFGKPQHYFHPADYTAYEPADNYTKKTSLWTGGGFIMPQPARDPRSGPPDDRIFKAPPGPDRGNFRSATPKGFARAVFDANHEALI